MTTQAERRAATRAKIIAAARTHFADAGFENTHTGAILAAAGVSRGAMYHHFESKRELFEAVFIVVSEETIARSLNNRVEAGSPLEELVEACLAWLRFAREPEVTAILLDEGPQVLGWKRARDLEEQSSLGFMKRGLERAVAAGELRADSIDLMARLVNALVAEIALSAIHADPAPTIAEQEAILRRFLAGLRAAE
ncbi:TetR/AcrR family transcriptional regulator [Hyphobacterium sp.]|uniref:TetR/AcrR family transcriptional regulator n=1 Tax=Hyphobacterium sp. TaxID=2004662 RepID=UPI003BA9A518